MVLRFVLKHQATTLVVTPELWPSRFILFTDRTEGVFPGTGYGSHSGRFGSPGNALFSRLGGAAASPDADYSKDPDVVSLSSFIGIDGTNMLPNSGRIQINLKSTSSSETRTPGPSFGGSTGEPRRSKGINLYLQPVQDLTVEDRISRTQFQYTMEDADGNELSEWAPKLLDKLRQSDRS